MMGYVYFKWVLLPLGPVVVGRWWNPGSYSATGPTAAFLIQNDKGCEEWADTGLVLCTQRGWAPSLLLGCIFFGEISSKAHGKHNFEVRGVRTAAVKIPNGQCIHICRVLKESFGRKNFVVVGRDILGGVEEVWAIGWTWQ